MTKLSTSWFLLPCLAALASACNPYRPDLGEEPFRCGTDEPRCPADYLCHERSETEHVCVRPCSSSEPRCAQGYACDDVPELGPVCVNSDILLPDAMPGPPDARSFVCNNDLSIEPNNSITLPTATPIPELGDDYPISGLAICPTTDIDIFRFRIDQPGKSIRADVTLDAAFGGLVLDILNATGTSVRSGMAVDGNPNLIRAVVNQAATGVYYARVQALAGVENNYSIHIITTGP